MKINGLNNVKKYINNTSEKLAGEFETRFIRDVKSLANDMQSDLNDAVDKGAVAFTKRAIKTNIKMKGSTVSATIYVQDIQASYLYDVIVDQRSKNKFVPTSKARLNKYGNIPLLSKNIQNGKYKIVEQRGTKRLINVTAKKRDARVIGVLEAKNRKIIYDFYGEAEKGANRIITDLRGVFTFRRRG
ncbi:hypothetical protein U4P91_19705 [Klebsiella variicola subsp. variicola]|uniref:hypothetical protein n=1 Tax=Klebsiella variicola TaxID=244366 RepID=UPI002FDFC9CF